MTMIVKLIILNLVNECCLVPLYHAMQIQLPHARVPQDKSAIRTKKVHTDDVNLSRILASLPNGSLYEMQINNISG